MTTNFIVTILTSIINGMLAQFIPHGHCYLWQSNLVGLHLMSDLLIAISYYSIPITLIYFVRKRKDLPYSSVFLLFAAFILSCGTSHLMEIWTLWHPNYWISGLIKAITALISVYTAIEIFSLVPIALNFSSPEQLQLANKKLQEEIEERKQTEQALQESELTLRSFYDSAPMMMGIMESIDQEDFRYISGNNMAASFFGLNSKTLPGKRASELGVSEQNRHRLIAACSQSETTLQPMSIEFTDDTHKDKKDFSLTVSKISQKSPQENSRFSYIIQDISDRKHMEIALQESEESFRLAFEEAAIGMALVSFEGKFLKTNRSLSKILGYSKTELKKITFPEIIHPEEQQDLCLEYLRKLLGTKIHDSQFEKRYIHKLGHTVWILLSVSVVWDSQEQPQYFVCQFQDISDRKRMNMVWKESEEKFRLAFKNAPIGIALVNPEGPFLKVNRSLCKIVGYSEPEFLSLTFQDITHPEDLKIDLNFAHQLVEGKINHYQMEKRYFHKLGHTVWILLSVSLVRDIQKQPQYFVAQIQDISERKAVETEITKSLQAQLEEKEVLLKEIHHRVKNNLQVICSLLNLQSRYLKEEKFIKSFKETQNRVKSMALVHEQLYQSKNLSQIVLLDYVEQLIGNLFRAYSITSHIKYYTKIDDFNLDLDAAVPCGLIINEIISNALKYAFPSRKQGKINIEAFADQANNLVLVIEDNGIGLKPDFDIANSKSLGLKLVKNLTQQLQGDFEIKSNGDSGTRFEFTFTRIKK